MAGLPAFDYEVHGTHYTSVRRTDPTIAGLVHAALGEAKTVLNVGAGSRLVRTDRSVRSGRRTVGGDACSTARRLGAGDDRHCRDAAV